jgi:hypothetical protein
MKKRSLKSEQEFILRSLLNKYQADSEGFRAYLPDVAQEVQQLLPFRRRSSPRSALTEQERERLQKALAQLLDKKRLPLEKAIEALESCATLIQDGNLPAEVNRRALLSLLQQVIGIPLSNIGKTTQIPVRDGEVVKEMALLHGVHLHLTWNDRLVAISVSPTKLKERSKALKFVGIAKDAASDVAQCHDAYLVKRISNATA